MEPRWAAFDTVSENVGPVTCKVVNEQPQSEIDMNEREKLEKAYRYGIITEEELKEALAKLDAEKK